MKRLYYLFALLFLLPAGMNAQVEFAPLGATWHYEYQPDVFQFDLREYWKVTAESEVQVGGKTGKQLIIEAQDQYIGQWTDTLLVWQEGQQVFFYEQDSLYLLYDFGLETGDTLEVNIPDIRYYNDPAVCGDFPHEPLHLRVDSTGTLDVNGELRKTLFFEYLNSPGTFFDFRGPVIEGIGSFHFIAVPCEVDVFEGGYFTGLRCYEDSQVGLYKRVDYACDSVGLITHIHTENIDRQALLGLSLFPNPASEVLRIETSHEFATLRILDLHGRVLSQQPFSPSLKVAHLPEGIYLLQLVDADGRFWVEKIVMK